MNSKVERNARQKKKIMKHPSAFESNIFVFDWKYSLWLLLLGISIYPIVKIDENVYNFLTPKILFNTKSIQ